MANKVIVATLYKGDENTLEEDTKILHISPAFIKLNFNDILYLSIQLGNVEKGPNNDVTSTIRFTTVVTPFGVPSIPITSTIGDVSLVGKVIEEGAAMSPYSLSVWYNGQQYFEDPKISVNPPTGSGSDED